MKHKTLKKHKIIKNKENSYQIIKRNAENKAKYKNKPN